MLPSLRLTEGEYVAALQALEQTFPISWAREGAESEHEWYAARRLGLAAASLQPVMRRWPRFHPVPRIRLGEVNDWASACELLRVGLLLARTQHIARTASLRARLRDSEEYPGASFELEVLGHADAAGLSPALVGTPDLVLRAGDRQLLVELRVRRTPVGAALAREILLPFDSGPGCVRVTISPDIGQALAGRNQNQALHELAECINHHIREVTASKRHCGVEERWFSLTYDPAPSECVLEIQYGGDATDAAVAGQAVHAALREKIRQLGAARVSGVACLIGVDCRGLVDAPPSPYKAGQVAGPVAPCSIVHAAVREQVRAFLRERRWISGVLIAWPRSRWDLALWEAVHRPWILELVTCTESADVTEQAWLREHLTLLATEHPTRVAAEGQ